MLMTLIPIAGLACALFVFIRRFILTDEKANEIAEKLKERKA
jgi:Na+/melibiose symporter-like transporter